MTSVVDVDDEFPPGWRARAEEMFSVKAEKRRRAANPSPRRGCIIGRRRQEPRKIGRTDEAEITRKDMDRVMRALFAERLNRR